MIVFLKECSHPVLSFVERTLPKIAAGIHRHGFLFGKSAFRTCNYSLQYHDPASIEDESQSVLHKRSALTSKKRLDRARPVAIGEARPCSLMHSIRHSISRISLRCASLISTANSHTR